ncbi:kinesin-like protein KIF2A isoform X2, partial [Clarias magur]
MQKYDVDEATQLQSRFPARGKIPDPHRHSCPYWTWSRALKLKTYNINFIS